MTITEFPNSPERAIDGRIDNPHTFGPPGPEGSLGAYRYEADLRLELETPKMINFIRYYPRFTGCGNCCPLCRTERNLFTSVLVNDQVECVSRYHYTNRKMLEVLDSCDHWLYFDCPMNILAEELRVTNHQIHGNQTDILQIVELQAGFDSRLDSVG